MARRRLLCDHEGGIGRARRSGRTENAACQALLEEVEERCNDLCQHCRATTAVADAADVYFAYQSLGAAGVGECGVWRGRGPHDEFGRQQRRQVDGLSAMAFVFV